MNEINYKKTGRIVGILYIIGTVTGIISAPFLNARNASDYLTAIGVNQYSFIIGAVLVLIMGTSLALIPAFMFPILRRFNEPFGVWYIIFRGALETVTYIIRFICFLSLATLSANYIAGTHETANLLSSAELINTILNTPTTVFVFSIGALLFYTVLYKYRLIPQWISGWVL